MLVSMDLISADEEVDIGDDADFNFVLSNMGNINGNVNVSIIGIDGAEINGLEGNRTINLLSGSTNVACLVSFGSEDLKPGLNEFTILIERNDNILVSQNFSIQVKQVTCSISSDGYEYTGTPLNYKITLSNLASEMDIFAVEIVGLDQSSYILDPRASAVAIAGYGNSITLNLTIKPNDITKVYGGTNGFGIKIKSQVYSYDDIIGASGVIMPKVYKIEFSKKPVIYQNDTTYDLKFVIKNNGNLGDIFTIKIENINVDVKYEILSIGLAEGSENEIQVRRGESIEVIVRFHKNIEGKFNPTIKVINSNDQQAAIYNGNFWVGFQNSPMFLVAIIISIAAAMASIIYVTLYHRGIIAPGVSGRFSNKLIFLGSKIKSKILYVKDTIKHKFNRLSEEINVGKIEKDFVKRERKTKKYIESGEYLEPKRTPDLDLVKSNKLKIDKTKNKIDENKKAQKYWNLDDEEDVRDLDEFNAF